MRTNFLVNCIQAANYNYDVNKEGWAELASGGSQKQRKLDVTEITVSFSADS